MSKVDIKALEVKITKLAELLKSAREENDFKVGEIAKLKRALALAEEVMKRSLTDPDSLPKLLDALKTISEFKMPDEIKVSNLPEPVEFPKGFDVNNFPKAFDIGNLPRVFKAEVDFPKIYGIKGWKDLISELGVMRGLLKGVTELKTHLFKASVSGNIFVTNKEPSEAIPVRLTTADARAFYNAFVSVMGSGGDDNMVTLLRSILTALENQPGASSSVGDGTTTVTTAGTRVNLPNVAVKKVVIQAHETNLGTIVVGGATCVAATSGRRGTALFATQSQVFEVNNLNLLYIDSTSNGDKINYYYEV